MHSGKLWNLGGDPGRFAASPRTLWLLRYYTGKDHSGLGLSQDEAFEKLTKAREERRERRRRRQQPLDQTRPADRVKDIQNTALSDSYFWSVLQLAIEAANIAGDEFVAVTEPSFHIYDESTDTSTPVFGALRTVGLVADGSASVQFTDFLKRTGILSGKRIMISHKHAKTLGANLQQTCVTAMVEVFRKANVKGVAAQ